MIVAPWLIAVLAIAVVVSWLAIPDAGARIFYAALVIAAVPTRLITRSIRDSGLRILVALPLLFAFGTAAFYILLRLFWR